MLPYHHSHIFVFEPELARVKRERARWWAIDTTPQSVGQLPGWGSRQEYVNACVAASHVIRYRSVDDDTQTEPMYPFRCSCNGCISPVRPARATKERLQEGMSERERNTCVCDLGSAPVFLLLSTECSDSDWEQVRWCRARDPVPVSEFQAPTDDEAFTPHPM